MTDGWRGTLATLGFVPYGDLGAMRVVVEDVEYVAIPHPLKGLAIMVTYVSERRMAQFENAVPLDATRQQVAQVMTHAFEQVHPDRKITDERLPN